VFEEHGSALAMLRVFVVLLATAGAFVWLTSAALPPVVASHFGPGGAADGHMGKGPYTAFMVALVIALPLLVASTSLLVRIVPPEMVNLPNRQYWLAPERRAASLAAIGSLLLRFASALAMFLCFVHWLVVQANLVQPPRLPEAWFFGGLAAFGVVTLAWLISLFLRFGRVP
jgi:hypothetical protein